MFEKIVKTLGTSGDDQLKDSLFRLLNWIPLLNSKDFTDAFESIKKCIHGAKKGGGYFLIKGLKSHIDNSPEKVGELLLEVLEQGKIFNPSYEETNEDLCYIVKKLSEKENSDIVIRIKNAALKNGYAFARDRL